MINLDECLKQGLLRKIAPSITQAEDQMEKAKVLLEEAKSSVKNKHPNTAVMAGYAAMFDAGRALLFKDGYRERSHACVARYLETNYSEKIDEDFIYLLDQYRDKRHKVMYSSDYYPTIEEARNLVDFAERFIEKIEKII